MRHMKSFSAGRISKGLLHIHVLCCVYASGLHTVVSMCALLCRFIVYLSYTPVS